MAIPSDFKVAASVHDETIDGIGDVGLPIVIRVAVIMQSNEAHQYKARSIQGACGKSTKRVDEQVCDFNIVVLH